MAAQNNRANQGNQASRHSRKTRGSLYGNGQQASSNAKKQRNGDAPHSVHHHRGGNRSGIPKGSPGHHPGFKWDCDEE